MKIGILGAGTVGSYMGKGWTRSGHEVMYSSREPNSPKMQTLLKDTGDTASAGTVAETLAYSDIIAVAIAWDALPEVLQTAGKLPQKILIDATNRFGTPPSGSVGSAAQDIAHFTGAKVVKAFNTIGAEHYLNPVFNNQAASMLICGDDADAKTVVAGLALDLGFEVVDVGGLNQAVLLENLARLWVTLAMSANYGRDIAFKLLRRSV
jgi:hypothetical protein